VLVVAALAEEVAHVQGVEVLVTGVGKAVAAATLARRLAGSDQPSLVVNVGTAGALDVALRGVVEVGYVTQHDFPYVAIEVLAGPVDRAYRLSADAAPQPVRVVPAGATVLATGDMFVADPVRAAEVAAAGASLVDMEGFAYAAACASFGVPLRCVKAVSDAADEEAGSSWLDMIDGCAQALGEWVDRHIRGD
jgi:predicted 5'-methylthioadenosine/S-adenosylhomocysteine nucleosidase